MKYVAGYVDYRRDRIELLFRSEGGELRYKSLPASWVAYARTTALSPHLGELVRSEFVLGVTEESGGWSKIRFASGDSRRSSVEGSAKQWFENRSIELFEGDVSPLVRHFVDHQEDSIATDIRIIYLDIETDSRIAFSNKEEMRVVAISLVAGCDIPEQEIEKGKAWSLVLEEDSDNAEADLLEDMFEILQHFDVVSAWYGDGFDFPVLRARASARSLGVDWRRWNLLDQLELYKKLNAQVAESGAEKQSYSLNAVATALLGEGKHDFDASKTWEEWAKGGHAREVMSKYCEQDTRLLLKIEEATGYIKLFTTICAACNLFVETRSTKSMRQMDGFMFRLGEEQGHHFSSIKMHKRDKFQGAFVLKPRSIGILHNVHVADFSSLYPSVIISFNLSPDTIVDKDADVDKALAVQTGVYFRQDRVGILPRALTELIALRKKFNSLKASLPPGTDEWHDADRWSTAYKVLANSFYGVIGSPMGRYYHRALASSVTAGARWLIQATISEANKKRYRVVYGDTDSLFVDGVDRASFEQFVGWCNSDLYPSMLATRGCVRNKIKLAYEKEFATLVFVAAKKYLGSYVHYKGAMATKDSKPEIKGLEYKRGDTIKIARDMQGEIIEQLASGCIDEEVFSKIVVAYRDRIISGDIELEDVMIAQSISKPLDQYAVKTAHLRVAEILLERGEDVSEGTKIQYYIRGPAKKGGGGMDARPASDWDGEYDHAFLWSKRVYPASYRLLVSAFPDHNWETYLELESTSQLRRVKKNKIPTRRYVVDINFQKYSRNSRGPKMKLRKFFSEIDSAKRGGATLKVTVHWKEDDDNFSYGLLRMNNKDVVSLKDILGKAGAWK